MKTSKELYKEFVVRKKLRRWSKLPVIGNIIKKVNPYRMFNESNKEDNKEN